MTHWRETPIWSADPPWSERQITESTFRDFKRTRETIAQTRGGQLQQATEGVEAALSLFLDSVDDLRSSISLFKGKAVRPGFWDRPTEDSRQKLETNVQRGLFCSSMAAKALADHTRSFAEAYPVSDYEPEKDDKFANNPEHRFIQDLRNCATHVRPTQANWRITRNVQGEHVQFLLHPSELTKWQKWTALSKDYMDQNPDGVDVEPLFDSYTATVTSFHEWLRARVWGENHQQLQQYYQANRTYKAASSKATWRIVLQQLAGREDFDPYQYLGRYLRQPELEEVLALPHRSPEQVDRIIHYVDEFGACDEEIRKKVYGFFGIPR